MKVLIYCYSLGGKTGSPIRAINIIEGLEKYVGNENIVLISRDYSDTLIEKYKCVNTTKNLFHAFEQTIKDEYIDVCLNITHVNANRFAHICRKQGVKFFVDVHAFASLEILEANNSLKEKIRGIRSALGWFKGLIAADAVFSCNHVLHRYLKHILGKKVIDVSGITKIDPLKQDIEKGNTDKVRVIYAGNLKRYQGVGLYLDAIKLINDDAFEFFVLGDVDINDGIQQKLNELLATKNNFTHLKSIPYAEFQNFMESFDVVVIPRPWSLTSYMALPQKLVEAMCLGKCIVATDILPHRLVLKECGILSKANPKAFAKALLKTKDHSYRLSVRKSTLAKATELFNYDEQIEKIYNRLKA